MIIRNVRMINKGAFVCSFEVELEAIGLTIRECSLMKNGNGTWINFPSRTYEKDGKKKYFSYIVISDERRGDFDTAVKALLDKELASASGATQEEIPF